MDSDPETAEAPALPDRKSAADRLARTHSAAAFGVGLMPLPLIDIIAVGGVQLDLIRKLAALYDVPFQAGRGRAILVSLLGGLFPVALGLPAVTVLKFIPLVGATASAAGMPVLVGASTYAVHKVFVDHFEAGGTLADFDTTTAKQSFARYFTAGKTVAADLGKGKADSKAA